MGKRLSKITRGVADALRLGSALKSSRSETARTAKKLPKHPQSNGNNPETNPLSVELRRSGILDFPVGLYLESLRPEEKEKLFTRLESKFSELTREEAETRLNLGIKEILEHNNVDPVNQKNEAARIINRYLSISEGDLEEIFQIGRLAELKRADNQFFAAAILKVFGSYDSQTLERPLLKTLELSRDEWRGFISWAISNPGFSLTAIREISKYTEIKFIASGISFIKKHALPHPIESNIELVKEIGRLKLAFAIGTPQSFAGYFEAHRSKGDMTINNAIKAITAEPENFRQEKIKAIVCSADYITSSGKEEKSQLAKLAISLIRSASAGKAAGDIEGINLREKDTALLLIDTLKKNKWNTKKPSAELALIILQTMPAAVGLLLEEYKKAGWEHLFTGWAKRREIFKIIHAVLISSDLPRLLSSLNFLIISTAERIPLNRKLVSLIIQAMNRAVGNADPDKENEMIKEAQRILSAYHLLWDKKPSHSEKAFDAGLDQIKLLRMAAPKTEEIIKIGVSYNNLLKNHRITIPFLDPKGYAIISAFIGAFLEAQLKSDLFVSKNEKDKIKKFLEDDSNKERFDYALSMIEPLFKPEFYEKLKRDPALIFEAENARKGLIFEDSR